jgi:phage repressor protein C with HTH and peptisase S24 domain
MLTHKGIWQAIDRLASKYARSPSGLARKAGLDPTTFNKSKRVSHEGKPRWPSTESVAKMLAATGADLREFIDLIDPGEGGGSNRRIPLIGMAKAGEAGFFDDSGSPAGEGWDQTSFPDTGDPAAYALEISGDSMAPVFRDGAIVIVSPKAAIRRGDRVVVKTTEGEIMAKQLARQTADHIELSSFNAEHADRVIERGKLAWMARILWVSQ